MLFKLIDFIRGKLLYKLTISSFFAIFMPLLIVSVLLFNVYTNTLKDDYVKNSLRNLESINTIYSETISGILQSGRQLSGDIQMRNIISNKNVSDMDVVLNINNYIIPYFQSVLAQNHSLQAVFLYHTNKRYSSGSMIFYSEELVNGNLRKEIDEMQSLYDKNGKNKTTIKFWPQWREPVVTASGKDEPLYLFMFPLYSRSGLEIIGYFQIVVKDSVMTKAFSESSINEYDYLRVVDKEKNAIRFAKNEKNERNVLNGSRLITVKNNYTGFVIEQYVNTAGFSTKGTSILYGFMMLLVFILLICLINIIITKSILVNISKLNIAINTMGGGCEYPKVYNIKSKDEIFELAQSFNLMSDNLKQSNLAEKEAIYNTLVSQVKPHFLCNALDMIRMEANLKEEYDLSAALEKVAKYFMFSITNMTKYVTIKDELENVINYVSVFNMIKKDHVSIKIATKGKMNGQLNKYAILKFTLQPIIENSIKHGFAGRNGANYIHVTISEKENFLLIEIEDNGEGMGEDRLLSLKQYLNGEISSAEFPVMGNGIGLKNVIERFQMTYSDQFSYEIKSTLKQGTKIELKLPLTEKEKTENESHEQT